MYVQVKSIFRDSKINFKISVSLRVRIMSMIAWKEHQQKKLNVKKIVTKLTFTRPGNEATTKMFTTISEKIFV